ncbi:glycosyltransferase family 1 protein [uncultured Thiohalocapsa sp.]|uniref:glycosyltransferase family protein n=1 Tax=uncultured Thiohalocapsa sp. TaxID=768990 RepID=UPI0025D37303|nr:glycosyltransferase family 1 protein [uncultured Thiohalocapsa sp.]
MSSDLIVVADRRPWAPNATFQLMSRLLLDRRILWVDADAFRRDRLDCSAVQPPGSAGGQACHAAPFPVLTAEDLGAGSHPLARLVSPRLLARRVARAAQRHGLRRPLLWLASPWASSLLDDDNDGPVIYQAGCTPPPSQTAPAREHAAQEARILRRADLVLVPTRDAARDLDAARARLLPAGVDLELFSTPAQPARDLPSAGPVAGCHGCFDERFDAGLLAAIAHRLPDWRFMLLGPVYCDLSALRGLTNVHVAGSRPQDQLPRYLQFFTASLLLRRPDAPPGQAPALPLLETLATGLPTVVAGALNLGGFADLATRVTGADAAADALRAAAVEPAERRALRRLRVRGDGWGARAATVNRLLTELETAAMPAAAARF